MNPSPRFCTHCGAPLPDGARFCGQCGTQVRLLTSLPLHLPVTGAGAWPAEQAQASSPLPQPPTAATTTEPVTSIIPASNVTKGLWASGSTPTT